MLRYHPVLPGDKGSPWWQGKQPPVQHSAGENGRGTQKSRNSPNARAQEGGRM